VEQSIWTNLVCTEVHQPNVCAGTENVDARGDDVRRNH
jgi:hypothetical protein